ncbi:MAG: 5'/3'-nucleotidase SurE [Elusimicrobiota bacterium]
MENKLQILLTNDDGVTAPGIWHLSKALSDIGDILIVAPEKERSGVSHAFTYNNPIYIREERINGKRAFSINGTPSDAVKIAVSKICKKRPDFLFAGINAGDNTGVSCYYSGTVSAAREGCFWRIPSIAVSVKRIEEESFSFAADRTRDLLQKLINKEIIFDAAKVLLNVNFPNCVPEKIRGIRVTRQGISPFRDDYEKRINPSGNPYYWIFGKKEESKLPGEDDVEIKKDMITITPLALDSTDEFFYNTYKGMELLKW